MEARSCNQCCSEKAINIAYSGCVSVALVTQHAKLVPCIILSFLACLALPCFSTFSHKRNCGVKRVTEHKICFDFLIFFFKFLLLRRSERDVIMNVYWYLCKVSVILYKCKWNLNFLDRFSKNSQVSNFMKIRPVGAEWTNRHDEANSRVDEQTWRS